MVVVSWPVRATITLPVSGLEERVMLLNVWTLSTLYLSPSPITRTTYLTEPLFISVPYSITTISMNFSKKYFLLLIVRSDYCINSIKRSTFFSHNSKVLSYISSQSFLKKTASFSFGLLTFETKIFQSC